MGQTGRAVSSRGAIGLRRWEQVWMVISVAVLVGSLALLAFAVTEAFVSFAEAAAPLWVEVVGALSVMGVVAGFGGLFLLLTVAGLRSFRAEHKVTVLPPER